MIAQYLDYPTLTNASMTAFFHHPLKLLAQCTQFLQSDLDLFEVAPGDQICSGAARLGIVGELQQFPNCLNAEAKFPCMTDETQPLNIT